jgi:ABC-2 type transport system permease protein
MEIFAFSAFYRTNPAAFPMEFSHTVSYIWLQQAFLALFNMWFWENDIADSILSGSISYMLVRPMDLYGRWYSQTAATRLARAALRCLPILLVAFLLPEPYRMSLPGDASSFVLFLISGMLGFGVVVAFNVFIYISLFYTISLTGMRYLLGTMSDFLSGQIIPLPFFPKRVLSVIGLLPFAAMQNMPLRIYSGNISGIDAYGGIALQVFWLCTLLFIGRYSIRRALKNVVVQGG